MLQKWKYLVSLSVFPFEFSLVLSYATRQLENRAYYCVIV